MEGLIRNWAFPEDPVTIAGLVGQGPAWAAKALCPEKSRFGWFSKEIARLARCRRSNSKNMLTAEQKLLGVELILQTEGFQAAVGGSCHEAPPLRVSLGERSSLFSAAVCVDFIKDPKTGKIKFLNEAVVGIG